MDERILALIALAQANGGRLKLALVGGSSTTATVFRLDTGAKLPDLAGGRSLWVALQDRADLSVGSVAESTGRFPFPKGSGECVLTLHPAEGTKDKPWLEFLVV